MVLKYLIFDQAHTTDLLKNWWQNGKYTGWLFTLALRSMSEFFLALWPSSDEAYSSENVRWTYLHWLSLIFHFSRVSCCSPLNGRIMNYIVMRCRCVFKFTGEQNNLFCLTKIFSETWSNDFYTHNVLSSAFQYVWVEIFLYRDWSM